MQSNVNDILTAANAISFEDQEGQPVQFDLVTARNFKENPAERILLVGRRYWEPQEVVGTGARSYDGYWVYPVYIYVPSNARDHEDYSDYTEAEGAAEAFLQALIPDSELEFESQDIYEAQMSSREVICAEVEVKKFATRRFLG